VLTREPDGTLTELQTISSIPAGYSETTYGAHIAINPAGTVVYVSNRGHNSIAVFSIAADGRLSLRQTISCGGNWPRFFILLGSHLVVANQKSENLVTFDVAVDGTLKETGKVFELQAPVALLPI
jgi:6-phosphogluconolactonase